MTKILVTAKVNPDLDGTACTLAYSELLKRVCQNAEGLVTCKPQSEVQYFIQKQKITVPTRKDTEDGDWNEFILVDASSIKGMPKVVGADKVIEIIDHRSGEPEKEFPNARIQNELIGAAATIIVERYIQAKQKPNPDHAKLLYGAIYHNSLNFIATNTSERDRRAAKYLEENFGLSDKLVQEMFHFSTAQAIRNPKKALEDDSKEFGDGYTIRACQLIVWGRAIFQKKAEIEKAMEELSNKPGVEWSFLNIVDLEARKSLIFSQSKTGQKILSKALGVEMESDWLTLPMALLRKQIMPKVHEALKNEKI